MDACQWITLTVCALLVCADVVFYFLTLVNVQLSGKMIGGQQLRAGIYDLIQKVRGKGKAPITSNLPSENFALGRGSKRLAG
jgi:hypothetical protein